MGYTHGKRRGSEVALTSKEAARLLYLAQKLEISLPLEVIRTARLALGEINVCRRCRLDFEIGKHQYPRTFCSVRCREGKLKGAHDDQR